MSYDNDYSSEDDGDMQRLHMLKQLWYDTKLELEGAPYSTSLHRRLRPSILGPSAPPPGLFPTMFSGSAVQLSSSASNGLSVVGSGSNSSMSSGLGMKKRGESIDPYILQVVMKQALERHGGSIHLDVVVKYVHERWPMLRRRNGTVLCTANDIKKYIQTALRMYKPCKDLFMKDPQRENCLVFVNERMEWSNFLKPGSRATRDSSKFARQVSERRKEPIAQLIAKFLQGKIEGVDLEEIEPYVLLNWAVPCLSGLVLEVGEIKEAIRTALEYDPIFHCISEEPFIYTLAMGTFKASSKRSRQSADGGLPDTEAPASPGETMPTPTPQARPQSKRVRPIGGGRRPAATVPRSESDYDEHASEDEKGTWICCDSCNNWVKAEDDGITDISIYDDSNPNHLEYNCPACRKARRTARTTASRSTGKREPRDINTFRDSPTTPTTTSSTRGKLGGANGATATTNNTPPATTSSGRRSVAPARPPSPVRRQRLSSTRTSRNSSAAAAAAAAASAASTSSSSSSSAAAAAASVTVKDDPSSDDEDLSEQESETDRIDGLYQELSQAYGLDRRSQEEVRRQKEVLAENRTKQWRKNREAAREKLSKLKIAHQTTIQRIEDDLMKQLREQFDRFS